MDDHLKKFVEQNREAFDVEETPDRVWLDIQRKKKRKSNPWQHVWRIAAVFFLISTIYLLIDKNYDHEQPEQQVSEFQLIESYYGQLISAKKAELKHYSTSDNLKADFIKEIERLDKMYAELKMDYHKQNAAVISDALITNLKMRIDLLDKQIQILEKMKNQKNQKNAVSTI